MNSRKEIFSFLCQSYLPSSDLVIILAAGDLVTFSRLKAHYTTSYSLDTELFTRDSRPAMVQALYEDARDKAEPQVRSEYKQKSIRVLSSFQRFSDSTSGSSCVLMLMMDMMVYLSDSQCNQIWTQWTSA